MIPVQPQPEPPDFDATVRAKGKAVLLEHNPKPPVPEKFWKNRAHWRLALEDLHEAYGGVCAFTAIHIEAVTGARTVEHFKPKSNYPQLAFEWDNFRLVCARMNGRKSNHEDVLDPFELDQPVFRLNPHSGEISIREDCPANLRARAELTLSSERLKLNDSECMETRRKHAKKILHGHWSKEEGQAASPFVFQALVEAGLL